MAFAHSYNSALAAADSPLGYGWTHSYNWFVTADSTNYYVHNDTGNVVPFPKVGPPYQRVLARFRYNADGTSVFTPTHGLDTYAFNAAGRLVSLTDRNGYATTLTYNGSGQLTTVTDPASRALTLDYYPVSARLWHVSDPTGRQVTFGYDPATGDLLSATDVGGQVTTFTYYSGHLVHTMAAPNSGVVTNVFDGQDRVTQQTDPLNRTLLLNYVMTDTTHLQTTITNTLGGVDQLHYELIPSGDSDNHAVFQLMAHTGDLTGRAATSSYVYSATFPSKLAAMTDPLGHTTRYTWDGNGNPLSSTDPLGRTVQTAYNATNDPLVITNSIGLTTTFRYDPAGNPLSVSRPITETGQLVVAQLAYDPARPGDVLTVTNPLGSQWRYAYDPYGYVLSTTNPLTETVQFGHDPLGRLLSVIDPLNQPSSARYNAYGNPTVITNTRGYTSTYTYDAVQNPTQLRDPNGHIYTTTYSLDNEPLRLTRPDGTHSDTAYDGRGRVVATTNALTQTTSYTYNTAGQLIAATDPLTRTTVYTYDLAGRLTTQTDARNLTTTLSYDSAGQVRSLSYSDGTTPNVGFDYDARGLRTVMTDGIGSTLYRYDSLARLTRVQDGLVQVHASYWACSGAAYCACQGIYKPNSSPEPALGQVVGYGYDVASRPITLTYPNGSALTQTFNGGDRLTGLTDWLGHSFSFGYDADGRLLTQQYPNGVTQRAGYDPLGSVLTQTDQLGGNAPFLSFTYTRDRAQLLQSALDSAEAGTHSYGYDSLDRLQADSLAALTPTTRSWNYDGATQITATSLQAGTGTPLTTTRSYDSANQFVRLLEQQGSTVSRDLSFSFDAAGNRSAQKNASSGLKTYYSYDSANRLTQYVGSSTETYTYNGTGLRQSKAQPPCGLGCTYTRSAFAWSGGLLLQEQVTLSGGSTGGSTYSYVYGPGGAVLEQINKTQAIYYHADQLGSIRALTDSAGSVSGTATYDAYGVVLTTTGTTTPCGYAGQYTDAESGLQYLRARYYDPATAQFLTVDPLLAQTDQAYAYADGSPTNKTDPRGLARKTDTTEAGGYGDEFWWYYVHHGTYPDAGLGAISWIWDGATGLAKFYQNWWSTAIQDPGYLIGLMGQSGLPIEVVDPKVDYLCSEFSGKAKGFESLGFTEANKGDLKALLEAIGTSVNRSRAVEVTNYGTKFVQVVEITGPNGAKGLIESVWQIDHGSDVLRFITAIAKPYP